MADASGLAELRKLGAKSVPVVSRGDQFVFAQVIKAVVDFLGLNDETTPELSPDELKRRYDGILEIATSLVKKMPDNKYNYENSKALCKAYGSRLAKYSDLENAYKKIQERTDAMSDELKQKFLNYPIPKQIIQEWEGVS